MITGFTASLPRGELTFFITKMPAAPPATADVLAAERVVYVVPELPPCVATVDRPDVVEACRTLLRACAPASPRLTFKKRAEFYDVAARVDGFTHTAAVELADRWPLSYIDFENGAVTVVVQRSQPAV